MLISGSAVTGREQRSRREFRGAALPPNAEIGLTGRNGLAVGIGPKLAYPSKEVGGQLSLQNEAAEK